MLCSSTFKSTCIPLPSADPQADLHSLRTEADRKNGSRVMSHRDGINRAGLSDSADHSLSTKPWWRLFQSLSGYATAIVPVNESSGELREKLEFLEESKLPNHREKSEFSIRFQFPGRLSTRIMVI